jgi:hypothetical protein
MARDSQIREMVEGAMTARITLGTEFCLALWPGHAGGLTPVGLLACCDVGQDAGSLPALYPPLICETGSMPWSHRTLPSPGISSGTAVSQHSDHGSP